MLQFNSDPGAAHLPFPDMGGATSAVTVKSKASARRGAVPGKGSAR